MIIVYATHSEKSLSQTTKNILSLHNQDCVALPRDQTPAWKDDKIKELEKQIKEKEKENKEKEKVVEKYKEFKKTHVLSFWCVTTLTLENKGASYSYDMKGLAEFAESDDCGYYKSIEGKLNGRNTRQTMIFSFYKPENTKYIKDIDECRSSWEEFVCFFKGNNPMKVKQLYFKYGGWTYKKASNARKKFACYRCDDYVCWDAWQGKPIDDGSGWERLFNSSYHNYKGIFGFFQLAPNNQSYRGDNTIQTMKDLMSYFHPLSFAIEDYLNSLSNENLTWNIEEFNKNKNFSFIWLMYWEDKQVRKDFIWNTYIKEIGWYGSWPQDWKILDEENQKVWDKGVPQHVQCLLWTWNNIEANPERKNYGLFYKINWKSRVKLSRDAEKFKIANNQYDIAATLLF